MYKCTKSKSNYLDSVKWNYAKTFLNNINNITKLNAIDLLTVWCLVAVFRTVKENKNKMSWKRVRKHENNKTICKRALVESKIEMRWGRMYESNSVMMDSASKIMVNFH